MAKFLLVVLLLAPLSSVAAPLSEAGNLRLRHDLQLLSDISSVDILLTTWPLSSNDINSSLGNIDTSNLSSQGLAAYRRVKSIVRDDMSTGVPHFSLHTSAALRPRFIRTFQDTPREEGELGGQFSWVGDRFTVNLAASISANPFDDDEFRPDGTYVGVALGNWMLTAGWQERWWGPGRDGSLILSTNARPSPGVSIQRNVSTPFESKWLRWIGPWTLTSFMTELDDKRVVNDAWFFGIRGTFKPPNTGLEIGISRTAQWCGDSRPCDLGTFVDLLVGNDNRGVNIDPENEPGNQLGGFDIRWHFPKQIPVALYMQWIGEDGRGGGGAIGSWLRQVGAEHWGNVGKLSHRTHLEISDTTCRQGGFGFSEQVPNCAYGHSIYRTGYQFQGKSLAHTIDGDGLSYSFGSTLVQSAGHSWNISLRYMEINQVGPADARHTLSPTYLKIADMQLSHDRLTDIGVFSFGLGLEDIDDRIGARDGSEVSTFVQWRSR